MGSRVRTHLGTFEILATAPKPKVWANIQTLTKEQMIPSYKYKIWKCSTRRRG